MKKRKQLTPQQVAKQLRALFKRGLPKDPCDDFPISAWEMAYIVQEQTGCDFQSANAAVQESMPELFAEYWEKHLENDVLISS